MRLYDVKSVEVLEGPQGTLYGAGSLGGVVRVVPRSPDLRSFEGSAWGGVLAVQHGKPGVDGGAILNLPLKEDVVGFRALAFGSVEGGYIDDATRGVDDINRVHTFGGRAALRVDPGNDWTIDLNAVGQRIDGDDSQYAERSVGELDRASGIAQPFRNDYWLVDLVARKNWGSLELTSSLGQAGVQTDVYTRRWSDDGIVVHLAHRDISFVTVSKASVASSWGTRPTRRRAAR